MGELLDALQKLATPEAIVVLDIAVLAALVVAVIVGVTVLRKLNSLKAAREEWSEELAAFSSKADAAEEGLARLRGLLLAEAERRRAAETAPEADGDARTAEPAAGKAKSRSIDAILSMQ